MTSRPRSPVRLGWFLNSAREGCLGVSRHRRDRRLFARIPAQLPTKSVEKTRTNTKAIIGQHNAKELLLILRENKGKIKKCSSAVLLAMTAAIVRECGVAVGGAVPR